MKTLARNLKGKVLLLLLSILSIAFGYYLLLTVSPDAPLEEVIRKALGGTILTLIGGITAVLHLFRRSK